MRCTSNSELEYRSGLNSRNSKNEVKEMLRSSYVSKEEVKARSMISSLIRNKKLVENLR